MAQYVPVRRGDLVSLYPAAGITPHAFSSPPRWLDEEYEKKVDVTDKIRSLWVVLEWIPQNQEQKNNTVLTVLPRFSSYVKVISGDRVCWVREYYLDVVRRAP